jgi:hypothetical protein
MTSNIFRQVQPSFILSINHLESKIIRKSPSVHESHKSTEKENVLIFIIHLDDDFRGNSPQTDTQGFCCSKRVFECYNLQIKGWHGQELIRELLPGILTFERTPQASSLDFLVLTFQKES